MGTFEHTGEGIPLAPGKDPDDLATTYGADWTDDLAVGEVIVTSEWIAPAGITVANGTHNGFKTTIDVSGGTENEEYVLTNRVTTDHPRQYDKSMRIPIRNQ